MFQSILTEDRNAGQASPHPMVTQKSKSWPSYARTFFGLLFFKFFHRCWREERGGAADVAGIDGKIRSEAQSQSDE